MSDNYDISWYTTRGCCVTILNHGKENRVATEHNQCDIRAVHDGKVR